MTNNYNNWEGITWEELLEDSFPNTCNCEGKNSFEGDTRHRSFCNISTREMINGLLSSQKDRFKKIVEGKSWNDINCNCNMCYTHKKAIKDILTEIDKEL